MKVHEFFSAAVSPLSLAACVAVCAGSFAAYTRLGRRWKQPGFEKSTRHKELAALALVMTSTLLFVLVGSVYMDQRVSEARMQAALEQRTAMAVQVRRQIAGELEAVRAVLIDRTQRYIADGKLAEAQAELTRFAPLLDPQIVKVIALIDKELEIRKLLEQSSSETAPHRLASIYSRLSGLAPDSAAYRQSAARYSAIAKMDREAPAAAASTPGPRQP